MHQCRYPIYIVFLQRAFANLPPHFDTGFGREFTQEQWEEILPTYSDLPKSFRTALRFMLASVVFHAHWLRENLPQEHPIFLTPLFTTGRVDDLQKFVHAGNCSNTETGLNATGATH